MCQSDILQSSALLCSWEKMMKDFRQAELLLKEKLLFDVKSKRARKNIQKARGKPVM